MSTNLVELRYNYPHLFYGQNWYNHERFAQTLTNESDRIPPSIVTELGTVPTDGRRLPLAAELASSFVRFPDAEVFTRFLWCRDMDRYGQRIFVGGVCPENGWRLEIHRHLHITEKWAVPKW